MKNEVYAIFNKEEKKFLCKYEDGEGNEWYSTVDFLEIHNGALFSTEKEAESVQKEAQILAGFSTRTIGGISPMFVHECEIIPVLISFLYDEGN